MTTRRAKKASTHVSEALSEQHDFFALPEDLRWMWSFFLKAYKTVVDAVDKGTRSGSDLSLAEYELILCVMQAGGRIRFIDLAKLTLLSQSRISRQIDALQAKGYIEREITASDRRATFAILTPAGQQALAEAGDPFYDALRANFFDLVPPDLIVQFTTLLERLVQVEDLRASTLSILREARAANGHVGKIDGDADRIPLRSG